MSNCIVYITVYRRRPSGTCSRSESLYLLPGKRCEDERRHYILECLERSRCELGPTKSHSGMGNAYGTHSPDRNTIVHSSPHIGGIYLELDRSLSNRIAAISPESFGMQRVRSFCHLYDRIWHPFSRVQTIENSAVSMRDRGLYPYVDDTSTVLAELNKSSIVRVRHRVNADNHPLWAIRTARIRKRNGLVKQKRRSISQDSIRSLQSSLISIRNTHSG